MTDDELGNLLREALQEMHDCEPGAVEKLLGVIRDNPVKGE